MLFGLRIDPNHADVRTLETLPRIGPSRAAAIVEARGERPFSDIADLERVPGIGPKTRRAIEPWLATSSEASLPQNR
jgi:competence protein ComEA